MVFQKLVYKLLNPESFERKLLCLLVFTFYSDISKLFKYKLQVLILSFSSSEFMDYLTSTLPSLTSPPHPRVISK